MLPLRAQSCGASSPLYSYPAPRRGRRTCVRRSLRRTSTRSLSQPSSTLAQQRSQASLPRPLLSLCRQRLAKLSYDAYRDIRFRAAPRRLWHDQALFEVQFFHRGFTFNTPGQHQRGQCRRHRAADPLQPRSLHLRQLTALTAKDLPARTGFAGFRVHYPLHSALYKDELAVFLGASYFKILGRRQGYGLSARGLAVNTATVGGEEFP